MAILSPYAVRTRCEYKLWGESRESRFSVLFYLKEAKWYVDGVHERPVDSMHTPAKGCIVMVSDAGRWTEWPRLFRLPRRADWHPYFGGRARGVTWFQQKRGHSTVSMLAPPSTQWQENTNNRSTYRCSLQGGTTDSVHKTVSDKWPVPAWRLTQTHLSAAVQNTGDQKSLSLFDDKQIDLFLILGEERRKTRATSRRSRTRIHLRGRR